MLKTISIFCMGLLIFLLSACSGFFDVMNGSGEVVNLNKEMDEIEPPEGVSFDERLWTILVYMCGDNNLESAALEDLCEMEFSRLNTDRVTVLALVDRNAAYDTSYGNWYGTRLYKIETGRKSDSRSLISKEIECKELGLSAGVDTELDMSSAYTLSNALVFARKKFPANNYGLIMWGHGTGWRSGYVADSEDVGSVVEEEKHLSSEAEAVMSDGGGYRGFAYDSTSGTYMTLYQLGTALKSGTEGWALDFVGFDTCFGCELEVLYEISPYTKYAAGSEGLVSAGGWNYRELFDSFESLKDKSGENLARCAVKQFRNQYGYKNRASVVAVRTGEVEEYFSAADSFFLACGKMIDSCVVRDEVMELLYSGNDCRTERYSYGTGGSDVYLDVESMICGLYGYFGSAGTEIERLYSEFCGVNEKLILDSWASDRASGGIGLYFSTLQDSLNLSINHPAAYVKNKTADQIRFVENSMGYVPQLKNSESLLDKLFYTAF